MRCPLCQSESEILWKQEDGFQWKHYGRPENQGPLKFFKCFDCGLVFKDPAVLPTRDCEREHYLSHENDPKNSGYRAFLDRLLSPIKETIPGGAEGLDFGCGPTRPIEQILREGGLECVSYDPFFAKDFSLLKRTYDFVTCSEVVEHFHQPRGGFETLFGLLKPGGVLGVMTQLVPEDFRDWWYHRDPTHVSFYQKETMEWIANTFEVNIDYRENGVFLFQRPTL